ncbi:MAG: radical SAM family heme chaperone HemW [Clostridia bacterium]|nr:radical SAM family heme chaperone HemW [Clostridia bacterium]
MEIYIHIPFCARKCEYCSFVSFTGKDDRIDAYLLALLEEASLRKNEITEKITTLYIGGGTPSLLKPEQLRFLFQELRKTIPFGDLQEITMEANPGTLTESLLREMSDAGVNRVSMGMQSSDDSELKRLGRIHLFRDVVRSVELLNAYGLHNFNLDLIFGLPGQTRISWMKTLHDAIMLNPKHISAYGLIPEEGTPLDARLKTGEWALPDPEVERDMYEDALRILRQTGFIQYEISNFAREGFRCLHNIGYWTQIPYMGLGVSAASMAVTDTHEAGMHCRRRTNFTSLDKYIQYVSDGRIPAEPDDVISPAEARFETIMLSLRMNQGISERGFFRMHGRTVEECYPEQLAKMEKAGLLLHRNGAWVLSRRGMDIQNSILLEFMD